MGIDLLTTFKDPAVKSCKISNDVMNAIMSCIKGYYKERRGETVKVFAEIQDGDIVPCYYNVVSEDFKNKQTGLYASISRHDTTSDFTFAKPHHALELVVRIITAFFNDTVFAFEYVDMEDDQPKVMEAIEDVKVDVTEYCEIWALKKDQERRREERRQGGKSKKAAKVRDSPY